MARGPCRKCGEDKAPGSTSFCLECWLSTQPIAVQVSHAEGRLRAVPEPLWMLRVPKEDWPEGRRWCAGCQTFVRLRDCAKGASRCKACNSNAAHARMVEATYGITEHDFQVLWAAQGGRCYICQRQVHSKRPAVDHDHKTGKVRGLLCPDNERGCNFAVLGNIRGATLDEQLAMVYRIAEYLRNPPAGVILDGREPGDDDQ
jgi:hypothetical protein